MKRVHVWGIFLFCLFTAFNIRASQIPPVSQQDSCLIPGVFRYRDISSAELCKLKRIAMRNQGIVEISDDGHDVLFCKERAELIPPEPSRTINIDTNPAWISPEVYAVGGLRWLDIDDDGDLDLISAHYEGGYPARPEETRVWLNNGTSLEPTAAWVSTDAVWSTDLAVGDIDSNGFPDITVVNLGYSNVIYFQTASGLAATPGWSSTETLYSLFASLGDISGEGYLDIGVVNEGTYSDPYKPNYLYINETGVPGASAAWISGDVAQNMAGALGDYDEDGVHQTQFVFSGTGTRSCFRFNIVPIHRILSVAVDGTSVTDYCAHLRDGWIIFTSPPAPGTDNIVVSAEISDDLDFAVAVDHGNAKVYRDIGETLESTPSFVVNGTGDRREKGVSWIDIDNDGDLDLFVGGRDVPMLLYENIHGTLSPDASWASDESSPGCSDMDWIDMDQDGDMDLAVSSTGNSNNDLIWIHENIDGVLETTPSWIIPWTAIRSMCNCVAWGDMNGDGWPDLAAGFAGSEIRVYLSIPPEPTVTPTSGPSETPTPGPTDTPSPQPTDTPSPEPTDTQTPNPTDTPTATPEACNQTGVTLRMPKDFYFPGDLCSCEAVVCNNTQADLIGYPLFVILDILGEYYFGPEFTETFDNYLDEYPVFPPGVTVVTVIPEFTWPAGVEAFQGAVWYAALTDPGITGVFGAWDMFAFGWGE